MPVTISGTDGITSPTITTTSTIVSGTTVADATAVIRPLVSATSVASTSGTSIDFTSIPSWVKRITVMFNGVSTNGTSVVQVQLGDSGGIETTGYASTSGYYGAGSFNTTSVTSGFHVFGGNATIAKNGSMILQLISGNIWISNHTMANSAGDLLVLNGAGNKTLSDVLTQVRITTVNGTDAFDAGSINILFE
jgi:hypothetical protein